MRLLKRLELSTPFWEFLTSTSAPVVVALSKKTFYSLLGVSAGASLSLAQGCGPFYSLLGVSHNCPEAIKSVQHASCFLLPFGSFLPTSMDIRIGYGGSYSFYSLLGVSLAVDFFNRGR